MSFSPNREPPPAFVRNERPSSARRASICVTMSLMRSTLAAGSKMTVYLPGSMARVSRDLSAFCAAISLTAAVFISVASL